MRVERRTRGNIREYLKLGLLVLGCSTLAWGEGAWLPTESHLTLYANSQDCTLVRAMTRRAKENIEETRRIITTQEASLKKHRSDLESCGQQKGMKGPINDAAEFRLASLCPDEYEAWLTPSYRFYGLKEDLREAKGYFSQLQNHMGRVCQGNLQGESTPTSRVAINQP